MTSTVNASSTVPIVWSGRARSSGRWRKNFGRRVATCVGQSDAVRRRSTAARNASSGFRRQTRPPHNLDSPRRVTRLTCGGRVVMPHHAAVAADAILAHIGSNGVLGAIRPTPWARRARRLGRRFQRHGCLPGNEMNLHSIPREICWLRHTRPRSRGDNCRAYGDVPPIWRTVGNPTDRESSI